tara:strand:- start:1010 stop:1171 length:162 start_codon:yes stop_codon:yes gene_type:complete
MPTQMVKASGVELAQKARQPLDISFNRCCTAVCRVNKVEINDVGICVSTEYSS